MDYKIICDSCCDIPSEMYADPHFAFIPLTLYVGDNIIVDDETFDQASFLKLVDETETASRSACPSAGDYMESYEKADADMIFVVTLSKELSGSYNAARLGKDMYIEEHGKKNILVINSMSASSGEGIIAIKLKEMCERGMKFHDIKEEIGQFVSKLKTWFVLETLDTFEKNGRLSGLKYKLVTALDIKPIMMGVNGIIEQAGMGRGINMALKNMVKLMKKFYTDPQDREVCIAHCNNAERAEFVKNLLKEKLGFKKTYIVETKGVSSLYANDGGIIVCA